MEFEKPKHKNSKSNNHVKHSRKPKQNNNHYLIAAAFGIVVIFIAAVLFGLTVKRNPRTETSLLPTLAATDDNSAADSPSGRPTLPPVWTPTYTLAATSTPQPTRIPPTQTPQASLDTTHIQPLERESESTGRKLIVDVDMLPLRVQPDTSEQIIEYAVRGAIRTILAEKTVNNKADEIWWYVADGYGWIPSQIDGKATTIEYTPQALEAMIEETQQRIISERDNYKLVLQRGWMLYGQDEMLSAIAELTVAIAMAEEQGIVDPLLYEYRGKIYLDISEFDDAFDDFDQAISLGLEEASAYNRRALASKGMKHYTQALDDHNYAIQLNPDYGLLYSNLGSLMGSFNQSDNSYVDYFSQAIEVDPYFPHAYSNRGTYYRLRGDFGDHVIDDYTAALRLLPDDLEILNNRGVTYSSRGDYALAANDYLLALQKDPAFVKAYINRGIDYSSMGDDKAAIETLLLALQYEMTAPLEAFAYYNLGRILHQHEQYEAALYAYTRAVELDSRRQDAQSNLYMVYGALAGKDENVILAYPNLEGLITPFP